MARSLNEARREAAERLDQSVDDATRDVDLADRVLVFTRRPGRVKTCVEVDLPRPRELNIKRDPRFLAYEDQIWNSIEEEVRASA